MNTFFFTLNHPDLFQGAKYAQFKSKKGMQRVFDEDLNDWVDDQINYFKLDTRKRMEYGVEHFDSELHAKLI